VAPPGPTLPEDHPFTTVQMDTYWSGSRVFGTTAWEVSFFDGFVLSPLQIGLKMLCFMAGFMLLIKAVNRKLNSKNAPLVKNN
jgi:hypothetical protein